MKNVSTVLLSILAIVLSLFIKETSAQKLPDTQTAGLRAPANIKIDGKLGEWENKFGAYNKTIPLFYTIANDDNNLYIVLHSKNSLITSKILTGGVRLTFNSLKRDKGMVAITFPIVGRNDVANLYKQMPAGSVDANVNNGGQQTRDTQIARVNSKGIESYKLIRIDGVKAIDTLISIYNEEEVRVGLKIDDTHALNYELAIPLKYLSLNEDQRKLFYNIKVLAKVLPPGFEVPIIKTQNGGPPLGAGGVDLRSLSADTDFSSEYIFAKKP
ncbi:hypothetical protein [Mucilaginibacter myungsuensis]|uniref:Uncharacterized protein n=1 Tax=Mucilaginibacter myungsuensis TaxID=649104 RepID=A0A929KYY1_9SPHI|nr:hypothetical protein [Mucilaginibacter myungsuensis]MBE9664256.1 hypothetical protein [Mucilaginibacter myungsuensis]MDN3599960.1 hypothetical protein [Mucilaginibacter myungsuensis]